MNPARWPNAHDSPNLLILTSRETILGLAPALQTLAERCEQPGAMYWLPYFLDKGVTGRRVPRLVLLLKPEDHQGSSLSADSLEAAALFYEYRFAGLNTGIVTTGDAVGFNSVIAPAPERSRVAMVALRALVRRGARVAMATYEGHTAGGATDLCAAFPNMQAAVRQRQTGRSLRLEPTLDATLARLGKHTRFNLRYYRRSLEKQMAVRFVAEAAPLLTGADLEAINAGSLNPVAPAEFIRRVRSAATEPGSFLCGLQAPDGRWLSLLGGWRHGSRTVLHWQMNTRGFDKASLGTVARHFLLEAEVARGCRELLIHGGTPHTMHHRFEPQPLADLIIRDSSWRSRAFRGLAHLHALTRPAGKPGNFLVETMLDRELAWVPASAGRPFEFSPEKPGQFGSPA